MTISARINKQVVDLLAQSGCVQAPTDLEQVAKHLGLKIVLFDFPEKLSGILRRNTNAIGVNQHHHPNRQRFTIAHEIGHFHLNHAGGGADGQIVDEQFDKPTDQERQANLFASCLLMPEKWLKDSIEKYGLDLRRLAKEFKVSEQALTIRLLALGLVK